MHRPFLPQEYALSKNATLTVPVPKGYARLAPALRARVADVLVGLTLAACIAALIGGSNLEGVWLRLPVNLALVALLPVCWVTVRRMPDRTSPILRGGLVAGLIGLSVLAMALHKASGFLSLAGLLTLLSAMALRGSMSRALVRGRDVRVGTRTAALAAFETVEGLAAALVLVLLVWHFGVEAFRIPSSSMAPTLLGDVVKGDRVLVDKFAYQWRDPERWEPVVFRYPLRRNEPYVKRLIGMPGEQVLVAQGDIYIKQHANADIELLTKTPAAREVLWLPLLRPMRDRRDWVANFHRDGSADYDNGWIRLPEDSRATYPRDGANPTDIRDHDASFGATQTPPGAFSQFVVGDNRVRGTARLRDDGGLAITLIRDADEYTLELRPGVGSARLFHREDDEFDHRQIGREDLSGVEVGQEVRFGFWLADGELGVEIGGREVARRHVGTALLSQLRARDAEQPLRLDSPEALEIARAQPPGGFRGRVVLRALDSGADVRLDGIERDIYYRGRMLDQPFGGRDQLPLGVALGDDQHFVLGDNSPDSADSRYWTRVTLFFEDGTQVTGALDMPTQPELVGLLNRTDSGDGFSVYGYLNRLAHFTPEERGDDREDADARVATDSLELFKRAATDYGRAAIDFYTEGGGYRRVRLADVEHLQVESAPQVERHLFVGRPWAVFLSPRGPKFID
jgi:signal peptidase I